MADPTFMCAPDGSASLLDGDGWLKEIFPPNSLCKAMPCTAPDHTAWAQDHWLHGGAPALLVAAILISAAFALGGWLNELGHDRAEQEHAELGFLRHFIAQTHEDDRNA